MQKLLAMLFSFIDEALTFKRDALKLLRRWLDYGLEHADDPRVQAMVNDTTDLMDRLSQKVRKGRGYHG